MTSSSSYRTAATTAGISTADQLLNINTRPLYPRNSSPMWIPTTRPSGTELPERSQGCQWEDMERFSSQSGIRMYSVQQAACPEELTSVLSPTTGTSRPAWDPSKNILRTGRTTRSSTLPTSCSPILST